MSFTFAAATAAVLLSGCGDDKETVCPTIAGEYVGTHKVYLGALDASTLGVTPIEDTLSADNAAGATDIELFTAVINMALTGKANCNTVALDSVIFGPNDSLVIPSATFGQVIIKEVRAGGSGTINGNKLTTSLKIKKGKTNIKTDLIDLRDLSGRNLELKGSFTLQ
ncbi:MAG TPA: hypothetical protein PLW43_05180 [Chitinophagales bacterium]|nr:hypothetical protein [Chitinophagales bacterium]